jgi:peptide/nickel transport system permease protein
MTQTATEARVAGKVHVQALPLVRGRSPAGEAWRRFRRKKLAMASLIYICVILLLGLLAPVLPIQSFSAQDLSNVRAYPSWEHPLGTDDLGRDMLSRLIWGAQTAFLVATIPMVIAMSIGVTVGLIAAWYRGWIDTLLMRLCDYLLAFPALLLLIFLAATFKPTVVNFVREAGPLIGQPGLWRTGIVDYLAVLIILALVGWAGLARLVRGQALSLKEREYIEAARTIGASERRILFLHLLPNILPLLIVLASMSMGGAIAAESTLSFLGIGIVPPYPSWGSMIADSYGKLRTPYWWLLAEPLVLVTTILYAFAYLGDGLADALNPQAN